MFYIILLLFLLNSNVFLNGTGHNGQNRITRKRSYVWAVFSNHSSLNNVSSFSHQTGACRWLRGLRHQNKLCRKRRGLSEILLTSRELAVTHCKEQFQFDRWNCSYKRGVLKKVYRETAFLYSLTTSALTYSIARACSEGKLLNCRCATINRKESLTNGWKWGGCGDNIKDAAKITRKFLQLRQQGDWPNEVLNYNSEVGIKAIAENEIRVCACHGVSASCVLKTCFKRIQPFAKISEKLKDRYHRAVKITPDNTINMAGVTTDVDHPPKLYYLVQSPNYCHTTVGRRCKDMDNCATLCCGRGFFETIETVTRRCNCRWRECCLNVDCDICQEDRIVNICK